MCRARVATMRLRKHRQTELLALAGCHARAAELLVTKPDGALAAVLQVCCQDQALSSGTEFGVCIRL